MNAFSFWYENETNIAAARDMLQIIGDRNRLATPPAENRSFAGVTMAHGRNNYPA
jgi:hypothetical protein